MNSSNTSTKQLILQGHSRPIKDIKFSESGEFIYTASNDRNVISWNSTTGEKIRTYAHSAAVNIMQLTKDGFYMITGDNTGCVYLWETQGGVLLKQIEQDPTLCVRSVHLSTDDTLLLILYAGRMKGAASFANVYKLQDILDYQGEEDYSNEKKTKLEPVYSNTSGLMKIPTTSNKFQSLFGKPIVIPETTTIMLPYKTFLCTTKDSKYVHAKFAIQNKSILISREDGYLELINFTNGKIITQSKFHDDIILDFDLNSEKNLILTASRDGTACIINFNTFEVMNKIHPQNPTRNLNTCKLAVIENPEYNLNVNSINDVNNENGLNNNVNLNSNKLPDLHKINLEDVFSIGTQSLNSKSTKIEKEFVIAILSGGQDSKLVTTTNQKEGGFEILMYDALLGTEMANFLTHFGPVNTLAVSKGSLASGAEDATVRLYKMENYLFPIDKNK